MDADHGAILPPDPVKAFDDDNRNVADDLGPRVRHGQPETPCKEQAEVFVLHVALEPPRGRLEQMRGRCRSFGNPPSASFGLPEESRLRLGSGTTEVPLVTGPPGSGMVGDQLCDALGKFFSGQPVHPVRGGTAFPHIGPMGTTELHGSSNRRIRWLRLHSHRSPSCNAERSLFNTFPVGRSSSAFTPSTATITASS